MGGCSDSVLCDGGDHDMIYEPPDWSDVKILLDLADDPKRDVQTTTMTPRLAVVIPEELYERLLKYKGLKPTKREKKS